MMDAIVMLTLYLGAKGLAAKTAVAVPEPEFVRFQRSRRSPSAIRAAAFAPANTPAHGLRLSKPSALPGAEAGDLAA